MTVKVSSIGLKGLEGYRVQVEVRISQDTESACLMLLLSPESGCWRRLLILDMNVDDSYRLIQSKKLFSQRFLEMDYYFN
ncbi:hypothetical protein NC797_02915 [Aquibacillus sp. 3ASR75-11]|uniref:Uncharacterized protein n=1 Tax=Terrihalobacillus insolitus TaxID=2950438 RepID=A0A9X3WSI1_9BACI|nr:hypothetical protein [Terrihalobacillus insolitus]MDC3411865.1 hypothetical protein [Terrihalobacillus insolitus]MDC3423456.1 hypothetical protein [Terrihalobacillus insolitus]